MTSALIRYRMMILITTVLLVMSQAVLSEPIRMVWDKKPLVVELPVGKERLIHFPASVRVEAVSPHLLNTLSLEGTVYWTANQPFESLNIKVQEVESGHYYLLRLKAYKQAPQQEVIIMRAEVDLETAQQEESSKPGTQKKQQRLDYSLLTRFAAQQIYAPDRLRQPLAGVYPVNVGHKSTRRLVHGDRIEATPIQAWRYWNLTITAVHFQNRLDQPFEWDPRLLRGRWLASTPHHHYLGPAGQDNDHTVIYLVARSDFAAALSGY